MALLLPGSVQAGPIWEEEGGIMDPNGRDGTAPQKPGQDVGSIMDPDG